MAHHFTFDLSYKNFEGQTSKHAATLINILHQSITSKKIESGNFFESGTFKGLSACIFLNLDKIDRGFLIDKSEYLEIEKLKKFSKGEFEFIRTKSENFDFNLLGSKGSFSWAHLDASHYFENVKYEILNIIPYMNNFGLICLDDWSDTFSQVRAAYYYLTYKELIDWELVLTGFNKAFLCKKSNFKYFNNYLIDIFSNPLIANEEILEWQFVRTDNHSDSRNFHVKRQKGVLDGSTPRLYGEKIYGSRFYTPIPIDES